jgi:molybdopterin molybdotransferase
MLELEEALTRILAALPTPQGESVSLNEANGRFVLEPVVSPIDLPAFDNSAMDGYALRAEDVLAAKVNAPVRLALVGRAVAGEVFTGEVKPGTCVRLFTGSPMPIGADSVIMQEDTRSEPDKPGEILVLDSVRPWENVRFRGEDVRAGTFLAAPGQVLTAGRLSLLAAAGVQHVTVGQRPNVALLSTGSELKEPGQPLQPGQIYESNRIGLGALIRNAGAKPSILPLVPDNLEATELAISHAFKQCDLVVTTGGASVGELDLVRSAFTRLGGEIDFWKVAIKPGRPFMFGRFGNQLLLGLPGNPVSALVTFLLLVRPALLRMQGATELGLPTAMGVLAEELSNPGSRRHFVRVIMDAKGTVTLAGSQASHLLGSFAAANGLLDLPPQSSLPAGGSVAVKRWGV